MFHGKGMSKVLISFALVALMIFSSFALPSLGQSGNKGNVSRNEPAGNAYERHILCTELGPRAILPYRITGSSNLSDIPYQNAMKVMISFKLQNQSRLNSYLSDLSNQNSPLFHRYMTRTQFARNFSVSKRIYNLAVGYFSTFKNTTVRTYGDRISLSINAPSKTIDSIFNTKIMYSMSGSTKHYFPVKELTIPVLLESHISQVSGLNNTPVAHISSLNAKPVGNGASKEKIMANGYPAPIVSSGVQYLYGSDLQVAYCTAPLYNITYPTNEVVATILWAGNTSSGQPLGPFNPSNIYDYYNSTLPSGEPHSKLHGVPIGGAAPPGKSANQDTSGATLENTLDLEMIGSLAPGSNIYNVYGPKPTETCLNAAFAYILNPNGTEKGLNNVSVISNSWGTPEFNDTVWFEYLQEAQARGISVLASSGDSGDNPSSPEYSANQNYTNDFLNFPASMAFNNFGVTSVGGSTLVLSGNLHIQSQAAWYGYEKLLTIKLDPIGSVGGISRVFSETTWQTNTEANSVINGKGLGVPDIAAVANNTLMCSTVSGKQSVCSVKGTSIASPAEAGIIADINAVLNHYGQRNLGYLNPEIYKVANQELYGNSSFKNVKYSTGAPNQIYLPLEPFYNIHTGGNALYSAVYGYNLVTGWGSIYAYNYTEFLLNIYFKNNPSALSGVENIINISSLNFTTVENGHQLTGNHSINIEQKFVVSDQLGKPVYKVSDILNLTMVSKTEWAGFMYIEAQYASTELTLSYKNVETSSPLGLNSSKLPSCLQLKSILTTSNSSLASYLAFEVNGTAITMPLPGAAYIIGSKNYSYIDPFSSLTVPMPQILATGGLLDPEFGIVSSISGGNAVFSRQTHANATFLLLPFDRNVFVKSNTELMGSGESLTGGKSTSLQWVKVEKNQWSIDYSNNSLAQGIIAYLPSYKINFPENGLPSGQHWFLRLGQTTFVAKGNSLGISLINGTYNVAPYAYSNYSGFPGNYSFTVYGSPVYPLPVEFESASNGTLLKQIYTSNPSLKSYERGLSTNNLNLSYNMHENGTNSMAMDGSLGRMYSIDCGTGRLNTLNVTSDTYYNGIEIGKNTGPYAISFDAGTGFVYIYSTGTGNISFLNPLTLKIQENVTISPLIGKKALIETMPGTANFLIYNNQSGFYEINGTTGKIINNFTENKFKGYSPYFTYLKGNIYSVNTSARILEIINMAGKNITSLNFPSGVIPYSIFPSGEGQVLFISTAEGSRYPLFSFNASTMALAKGPYLTGLSSNASFDPLNGLDYIATSGLDGQLWILNPSNLDMLGSAPYISPGSSGLFPGVASFELKNQYIYAVNPESSAIYVYNVQHYYKATFEENNLPSGTEWFLNVTGRANVPVTENIFSENVPNGTYLYSGYSSNVNYILFPYEGILNVNGRPGYANLTFRFSYDVKFNETGLPAHLPWYVNVSELRPSGSISENNFTIRMPNGTMQYSVASSNKIYAPYFHKNTVAINGESVNISVGFYLVTFNLAFKETGLPGGMEWNATDRINTLSSQNQYIVFALPNGTYKFSFPNLKFYYNVIGNLTIKIHGKNTSEPISYYHYAYISGTLLPSNAVLAINGKVINPKNGAFNISEEAGYFRLVVSKSGYNTFHSDFSLRPGNYKNFNVKLSRVQELTPLFYLEFYGSLIAAIAAMVGVSIYLAIRRK